MKNIVIFGSGYHSKVIFSEIVKLKNYKFFGFVDEKKRKDKVILKFKNKSFKNLGKFKDIFLPLFLIFF